MTGVTLAELHPYHAQIGCPACDGSGMVSRDWDFIGLADDSCPRCAGLGWINIPQFESACGKCVAELRVHKRNTKQEKQA